MPATKVYVCCVNPECRKAMHSVTLPDGRTAAQLAEGYRRRPVQCPHCRARGRVEIRSDWQVPAADAS